MSERQLIEDVTANILRSLGLTKNVCEALIKDLQRLNLQQRRQAGYGESPSPPEPELPRSIIE